MICACSILLILLLWSSQPSRYCILILLAFVEVTLQNSCWILIVLVCLRQRWVLTCIMNSLISSSRLLESWYLSFYIFFTQLHIPLMKNYVLSWELSRDWFIYLSGDAGQERNTYQTWPANITRYACWSSMYSFFLYHICLFIYLFIYKQRNLPGGQRVLLHFSQKDACLLLLKSSSLEKAHHSLFWKQWKDKHNCMYSHFQLLLIVLVWLWNML